MTLYGISHQDNLCLCAVLRYIDLIEGPRYLPEPLTGSSSHAGGLGPSMYCTSGHTMYSQPKSETHSDQLVAAAALYDETALLLWPTPP